MRNMSTQRRENDKGFTLIELMVVVLIIAILMAIAIPTFLGAQNKAKDRNAQSSARNALTNAKVIFADSSDYTKVKMADLVASEPSLTFQTTASTGPKIVTIADGSALATQWFAAVRSETGYCFYIADNLAAATTTPPLPAGTTYAKSAATATNCSIAAASTVTYSDTGWK